MVATGLLASVYDKLSKTSNLVRFSVLIPLGLVTFVFWHNLTTALHGDIPLLDVLQAPILDWFSDSSYRLLVLLSWLGLFISGSIYLEKQEQKKETHKAQRATKEAQLQLLMTQLNPHFLFNVLNSIDVAILEKDTEIAHQMLVQLSQFLRTTLEHEFDAKIQLHKELYLLDHYIKIEKQRSKQQILFTFNIEPIAESAFVPPLILQPLIENAIKFSRQLHRGSEIKVNATVKNQSLSIEISNEFIECPDLSHRGTNTGVKNVKNRINLLYGESATLAVTEDKHWFIVLLSIPLEVKA